MAGRSAARRAFAAGGSNLPVCAYAVPPPPGDFRMRLPAATSGAWLTRPTSKPADLVTRCENAVAHGEQTT